MTCSCFICQSYRRDETWTGSAGISAYCRDCLQWYDLGLIHSCTPKPEKPEPPTETSSEQTGWLCPDCGRGCAPWVDYCAHGREGDETW